MIYDSVVGCIGQTPLMYLHRLFPQCDVDIIAKLEFLNPGGSIKDRPARFIIERGLQDGTLHPGSHIIESTSGNFGIALMMVARLYDLELTCVVDPNITATNLQILQRLGAHIDMVHERDDRGGYLKTRIHRVQELLDLTPNSYWINQYANRYNWQAHYYQTAAEILEHIDGPLDYLVAAVSTSGTIRGLATRLREKFPALRVVAVDALGSVIFGGQPHARSIPGIGASRVPEILYREQIDEVIYVSDQESIQGCYDLITYESIFAGGSSGSVVAALQKFVPTLPRSSRVLTILPDRGDRYLDTIYNEQWVQCLLPKKSSSL